MRTRFIWLLAVMAIVAAACGGSAESNDGVATLEDAQAPIQIAGSDPISVDSATVTTTPDGEIDQEAAFMAFTECMRDQGIEMSDPTVDAEGNVQPGRPEGFGEPGEDGARPDAAFREVFQAARQECDDALEGIALGFEQVDQTELQDTLLAYAECMRDNDYDLPDPDLSSIGQPGQGGGGGGIFGQIDREDPAFIAANDVCAELTADLQSGRGLGGGPGRGNG